MTKTLEFKPSEHQIQAAYFDWVKSHQSIEYQSIFAVPNETGNKANFRVLNKLKRAGLSKGVPDIFIPVPRNKYCGAVIETKKPGGKLSPEQVEWLKNLEELGWKVSVCFSTKEMVSFTESYLNLAEEEKR